jgi:hypothetical protein
MSTQDSSATSARSGLWLWVMPVLGIIGVGVVWAYVYQLPHRWGLFAMGVAVAGVAALAGGLIGFLFGIPHTVQNTGATGVAALFQGNTNLEQVSDWLTKIIVGVGLVQIGRLLPALSRLGRDLKGPLGGTPTSSAFGLMLVISYALLGFLFLYLWSRERLPGQLAAGMVAEALKVREDARSDALTVVNNQLSALKSGVAPSAADLDKAIVKAPAATQVLAYNQAEAVRSSTWETDKATMEQAIPVFQALIGADPDAKYHRTRGSLGWSLKDKLLPDWEAARGELTRAIAVRDKIGDPGWRLYEANRALCDIKLLQGMHPDNPRGTSLVTEITHDLSVARADSYAQGMLDTNPDLRAWLAEHPL